MTDLVPVPRPTRSISANALNEPKYRWTPYKQALLIAEFRSDAQYVLSEIGYPSDLFLPAVLYKLTPRLIAVCSGANAHQLSRGYRLPVIDVFRSSRGGRIVHSTAWLATRKAIRDDWEFAQQQRRPPDEPWYKVRLP